MSKAEHPLTEQLENKLQGVFSAKSQPLPAVCSPAWEDCSPVGLLWCVARGKPGKSMMPHLGRNLSKANRFLARDDISNILFLLGTGFACHNGLLCVYQGGSNCDVCPLCAPKPLGTIKAKFDKDPHKKNLGTGSFPVRGLNVLSKAKIAAVKTHTRSLFLQAR